MAGLLSRAQFGSGLPNPRHRSLSTTTRMPSVSPNSRQTKRFLSVSLVLSGFISLPPYAIAASILDKYVKRKKLDSLDAYVPDVILTELQIKDIEKNLELDQPQYSTCRSLLRSGPAAFLRVNIRAVAQYASDDGIKKAAFNDVDRCLRALEELDSLLLRASRNDLQASVMRMKEKIGIAVAALDSLLGTVPSEVLEKGKSVADAYRIPDEDAEPEILDPELKQLESIL